MVNKSSYAGNDKKMFADSVRIKSLTVSHAANYHVKITKKNQAYHNTFRILLFFFKFGKRSPVLKEKEEHSRTLCKKSPTECEVMRVHIAVRNPNS